MDKFKQMKLSNGAKLYYLKNNISKVTMVDVAFPCGSRCDTIPGLAHFTEHMFFTGTKTMDKKAITKKYFDFINVNAFTGYSRISFWGTIFTKEFKEYLNTVAEMVRNSVFDENSVKDECKVINQEIAMYKDDFRRNALMLNDFNLTHDDVYKYSTLGTTETISKITNKDIKNFVKKYFVQQNMHVYVASPLSISKVKKIIEDSLCKKIATNEKFNKLPLYFYDIKNSQFHNVESKEIGKSYLFLNFTLNCNYKDFKKRTQIELVRSLLNNQSDGIMSDLRWGDNKNLTYGASFYTEIGKDKVVLTLITECDKQNVNPIIETVANYIKRILTDGFKQQTLDFEKRTYKYSDDAEEPSCRKKFGKFSDFELYGEVRDDKLKRKYITETTLEQCNSLFKEVFENPELSITVYGDAKKQDVLSQAKIKKLFNVKR